MLIIVITKPFSLFKLLCLFCLKSAFVVLHTWMELLRASIGLHLDIFRRTVTCIVALISFPVRVLTALQRERLLEQQLNERQFELEALVLERKELKDQLQAATREHRCMELMLEELEDEHDKAIAKIEMLEGELQDLKDESLRMKEIQGKDLWSSKGHDDVGEGQTISFADSCIVPYGIPAWKSSHRESGIIFEELMRHGDAWDGKSKTEFLDLLEKGITASGSVHQFSPGIFSKNMEVNEVLDQRRDVALSQSLFSAILSLLVGIIIWNAKDPCMPLVVALFTVVGMSLKSVVEFFFTIRNKPASDAVALLSFNWFILGTLTYPTLPRIARLLSPLALSLMDQTLSWLGISSY